MARIQLQDYYCGGALCVFLKYNHDARPSLIEYSLDSSRLFKMNTDTSRDFYIFMKYANISNFVVKKGKEITTWRFNFTDNERKSIAFFRQECNMYLLLICSEDKPTDKVNFNNGSKIAIITMDEYDQTNNGLTITYAKHDKHFTISFRNSSRNIQIPTNRITKKLNVDEISPSNIDGKKLVVLQG